MISITLLVGLLNQQEPVLEHSFVDLPRGGLSASSILAGRDESASPIVLVMDPEALEEASIGVHGLAEPMSFSCTITTTSVSCTCSRDLHVFTGVAVDAIVFWERLLRELGQTLTNLVDLFAPLTILAFIVSNCKYWLEAVLILAE